MKSARLALALIGAAVFFSGCGRKGALLLPIDRNLKPVTSVAIKQRGAEVRLEWKNPETDMSGDALPEETTVEIWLRIMKPKAGEESKKPGRQAFEKKARKLASFGLGEKSITGAGETGTAPSRLYVHALNAKTDIGRNLIFGLRVDNGHGRRSDFSEPVSITPQALPLPPRNLRSTTFADRIEIAWDAPEANIDQTKPPVFKAYNIYRSQGEGQPVLLNPKPAPGSSYVDKDFQFGQTYRYTVRATPDLETSSSESGDSEAVLVEAKDTFPPPVPTGLTSLSGGGLISLSWDKSSDPDVQGYRVWRKAQGESDFRPLTDQPVPWNAYNDSTAVKGKKYDYAVTAVDAAGNESGKSDIVSERLGGRD